MPNCSSRFVWLETAHRCLAEQPNFPALKNEQQYPKKPTIVKGTARESKNRWGQKHRSLLTRCQCFADLCLCSLHSFKLCPCYCCSQTIGKYLVNMVVFFLTFTFTKLTVAYWRKVLLLLLFSIVLSSSTSFNF